MTKAVLESALAEEMTAIWATRGTNQPAAYPETADNATKRKMMLTDVGAVDPAVPQDRNRTFEPQIVRRGQTLLEEFNKRIIAQYTHGMTTGDTRPRRET